MLNNKNRRAALFWAGLALLCWLTGVGCTPPGPRALLEGKHLMEQGKLDEAIPRLQQATELMLTNATAWSFLGIAYHQNNQLEQAFKAYQNALKFDHNLVVLHYNLGCLYLDLNNLNSAMDELRTFTLLQQSVPEGWVKLGTAQYRARRFDEAEKSFKTALGFQTRSAEAVNGLGLIHVQRRRWQDAATSFTSAISYDTNFAPALLNLAVVEQSYLGNRAGALQHYRRYVALNPAAAEDVRATMAQLERELAPPPTARPNTSVTPSGSGAAGTSPKTNPVLNLVPIGDRPLVDLKGRPSSTTNPAAPVAASPLTSTMRNPIKPSDLVPIQRPTATTSVTLGNSPATVVEAGRSPSGITNVGTTARPALPAAATNRSPELEVAKVRDDVIVRPAQETAPNRGSQPTTTAPNAGRSLENTPPPAKKGFFSRLNPFSRTTRPETDGAVNPGGATGSSSRDLVRPEGLPEVAPSIARYTYLSPKRPSNGNREAALTLFKQGIKAQKAGDRVAAASEYQSAIRADPGFFDAYYNLGLVALDSGDARLSLWSYELALTIQPESADARYNLALALKAGNYPLDAADQLQLLVQTNPADARAHLSLANLYAQQLKQPPLAREHYLKVLELNPKHPDAATIRYWLAANP